MTCMTTRYSSAATTTVPTITRHQSRVYRQAWRVEPVTQKPAIGMIASSTAR